MIIEQNFRKDKDDDDDALTTESLSVICFRIIYSNEKLMHFGRGGAGLSKYIDLRSASFRFISRSSF